MALLIVCLHFPTTITEMMKLKKYKVMTYHLDDGFYEDGEFGIYIVHSIRSEV